MRSLLLSLLAAAVGILLGGCFLFSNAPPTARIATDGTVGHAPLTVHFDGRSSTDVDGIVVGYRWSFGVGPDATGVTADRTFSVAGTYGVTLTVTDEGGATAVASTRVEVGPANRPPTAAFIFSPVSAGPTEPVSFDGSTSADPDGEVVAFLWSFGDGQSGQGTSVEHAFAEPGTFDVTLTVVDDDGLQSQTIRAVTVATPKAQPADFVISPSAPEPGDLVQFAAAAVGDAVGPVTYSWRFGDGSSAKGEAVTHRYATAGVYYVTLSIFDAHGASESASRALEVSDESAPPPDDGETLIRSYSWFYDGLARNLELGLSSALYEFCRTQPRDAWPRRDYDAYVLDPLDDALMNSLAAALSLGGYYATVENALAFVQKCIDYQRDPGTFEYPRYPIETLVDGFGDCEDTAILYASVIRTLGHGALLVSVDTDGDDHVDHMVVFVPVDEVYCDSFPCGSRSFWEYDGRLYAFAETAVEGGYLALGVDPWNLDPEDIIETWDVGRVDPSPQMVKRVGTASAP